MKYKYVLDINIIFIESDNCGTPQISRFILDVSWTLDTLDAGRSLAHKTSTKNWGNRCLEHQAIRRWMMRLVMQSVCFQFRVGFKRWTKPFAPWQYLAWAVSSFSLRLWIVNPCKSNIDHYNSHITSWSVSIIPHFHPSFNSPIFFPTWDGPITNHMSRVGMVSMAIRIRSAWDPQQKLRQGRQVAVRQTRQILFRWDIASSLPTECYWHGRYDVHQSTNWSPQRIHH